MHVIQVNGLYLTQTHFIQVEPRSGKRTLHDLKRLKRKVKGYLTSRGLIFQNIGNQISYKSLKKCSNTDVCLLNLLNIRYISIIYREFVFTHTTHNHDNGSTVVLPRYFMNTLSDDSS